MFGVSIFYLLQGDCVHYTYTCIPMAPLAHFCSVEIQKPGFWRLKNLVFFQMSSCILTVICLHLPEWVYLSRNQMPFWKKQTCYFQKKKRSLYGNPKRKWVWESGMYVYAVFGGWCLNREKMDWDGNSMVISMYPFWTILFNEGSMSGYESYVRAKTRDL